MLRLIATFSLLAGLSLFGQASRGAWWNGPTIRALNLSPDQMRQMRAAIQQYRPHLQELRANVQAAEWQLEQEFDRDPVDPQRTNAAIEHLVAARSELTRTLSQMGLRLRMILTLQQWREVQRQFPRRAQGG